MATTESIRVLHVDDDPEFLGLTADMLEREDTPFTVETATSPAEARDRLADHEFDCIVSDYDMPVMDGIEFLSVVREEYPDLPFILFTGKGSEEVASDAISAGVTHYLQKRSGTDQYTLLSNQIQNAVQQYQASNRAANLARIRTLINDINQALVRANSREEVETAVCEILADADPYQTVWIGEVATDQVIPRTAAGVASGDLTGVSLSTETADTRPIDRAVTEQEIAVSEAEDHHWGSDPSTDGRRAMAVVPLVYDDTLFGVLVVSTEHAEAFDHSERSLLVELADDIAHALHAVHIQSELERRNDLFEKAEDIADVGAWEYDIQTEALRWTAEVYEIHDLPKETLVTPEEAIEFYHPEDRTAIREAFDRARDQGDSYDVEHRLITADDDYRWVRTRGEPQFEDGKLVRIRGTIQDITGRKEREQELQEVLERYEALFANTNDAIARIEYEDGIPIIQEANSAFRELFELPGEDVVGRDLDEVVTSDERLEEAREYSRTLADGRFVSAELTRDTVDGPRDFRWQAVPLDESSDSGDGLDAYAVYTDITERKQRERELDRQREQLAQRQEKLLRLRDYTQELMYAETDEETATIALRAVDRILGFELGAVFTHSETQEGGLELIEVLNRSRMEKMYGGLPAFVRDAPAGTHSALAWEVFETGESVFLNDTAESERLTRKSPFGSLMLYPIGQHGIILLAATRLEAFTETEELLLDLLATALETAFDRLERERDLRSQRDELERQNERLEQFASVVSHDLRNPLKVAAGRLELASEECESTHLADVGTALDRMDALIEDLLTVAREGKQVQTTEPASLSEIGEQCWATVTTDTGRLHVETERTIRADSGRLRQLLENLMRNAVEHGGQEVSITIGCLPDGFYVADDGPGIPEDDRDAVFEVEYSTTADGTGFGLAIVEEIADAHDWEVQLTESDAGGARFEITGVEIVG
jgi:PAS domain S-box-containing protein